MRSLTRRHFQTWPLLSKARSGNAPKLESLFRFDRIEAGLWILDLTRFLDANRPPLRLNAPKAAGTASVENLATGM